MIFSIRRDGCLVCGNKLPLFRLLRIGFFSGAECPKCHSYMRFSKWICAIQFMLYLLIFPTLNLGYFWRLPCLLAIVSASFTVAYFAKYEIDPAQKSRVTNGK